MNDLLCRHTDIVAGRLTVAVDKIAPETCKAGLKVMPLPAEGPCVDGRFLETIFSYRHAGEVILMVAGIPVILKKTDNV
jgi:hypothetical protein